MEPDVIRPSGALAGASPATSTPTVGIPAVAYAFAGRSVALPELAARGALASDASLLAGFGFDRVHVADTESPYELALAAARQLLAEHAIDPSGIDAIVCA